MRWDFLNIHKLQIYLVIFQWIFLNRLRFDRIMVMIMRPSFFWSTLYITVNLSVFLVLRQPHMRLPILNTLRLSVEHRWTQLNEAPCRFCHFFAISDLTHYLATVILIIIPSPTHSFTLRLNPSFSANPPYRSLSFFSFRIHYMDFPDCSLLLLSISVFLLFSFFLFLHFFSCRFRVVDSADSCRLSSAR